MQLEGPKLYDVAGCGDAFAHTTDPGIYQASGQGVTHPHPCTAYQQCCTELQTNMFCNLDKWTNTFCNLDKWIFQVGQIHFAILDKYKGVLYLPAATELQQRKDEHGLPLPQCSVLRLLCYSPEWILQGFVILLFSLLHFGISLSGKDPFLLFLFGTSPFPNYCRSSDFWILGFCVFVYFVALLHFSGKSSVFLALSRKFSEKVRNLVPWFPAFFPTMRCLNVKPSCRWVKQLQCRYHHEQTT